MSTRPSSSRLTIRREQMTALADLTRAAFAEQMVVHLHRFFPEACAALGEARVREAIAFGVQRAGRYDCRSERSLCKYLNLMFAFGHDFDVDPQLPWAAQILADDDTVAFLPKIDRLVDGADEHADQAVGIHHKPPFGARE
jgi:hypothetical protein